MWSLVFACSGDAAPPAVTTERSAALVYTANMDGEIEPCG